MRAATTRRLIRATPERLFQAWTDPIQLMQWWGPAGVECIDAHIDLRVGGSYGIANRLPDGAILWITGTVEAVEPPRYLAYSWHAGPQDGAFERVTVRFEPAGTHTEVLVVHQRIPTDDLRQQHQAGWAGCLDGLERYLHDQSGARRRSQANP
jgi:uncharacterized protein YndB with AHSA1/START domain